LQFETDQVSHQINIAMKEKEMSDQQIKLLENEAMQLHKEVEYKNKNFLELNDQLNGHLNEYRKNLAEKDDVFNQAEQFKTTSHLQSVNMQCELNKKEFEQLEHND